MEIRVGLCSGVRIRRLGVSWVRVRVGVGVVLGLGVRVGVMPGVWVKVRGYW